MSLLIDKTDYIDMLPFGVVVCDFSPLKDLLSGETGRDIWKKLSSNDYTTSWFRIISANKTLYHFAGVKYDGDISGQIDRMIDLDLMYKIAKYILNDSRSVFEADAETINYNNENYSFKIFITPHPDDDRLHVLFVINVREYRNAERQIFKQWLLYHSVNRLFRQSIALETVNEIIDSMLEELSEINLSSVSFCVYNFNGNKYSNIVFPKNLSNTDGKDKSVLLKSVLSNSEQLLGERIVRFFDSDSETSIADGEIIRNILIVPVENDGKIIASLGIINKEEKMDFSDQQVFETIAVVLRDVILHKLSELERIQTLDKLAALYRISSLSIETLNLFDFAAGITAVIKELHIFSNPEAVSLYISEDNTLFKIGKSGEKELSRITDDEALCMEAVKKNKVLFSGNSKSIDISNGFYSYSAIPLIAHLSSCGCLLLKYSSLEDIPSNYETEIYEAAANQIALALSNIKLFEKTRILSLYDPLTGLANRRQMESILQKSAEEHRLTKKLFSIIMADIDHFKEYNDSFGHETGDVLLSDIAKIIKDELRSVDTVTRYGGEEFLIVLPDISEKGAINAGERIRAAVQAKTPVTISLGVSASSEECDIKSLVGMADKALYYVKLNGRNGVKGYSEFDHY